MRKGVVLSIRPAKLAASAALCAVLAMMATGCSRSHTRVGKSGTHAADTAAGARKSDAAPAVRVSAEQAEAAEPAAASGPDGTGYVAWVEHRGKEADVWLAHFDGEERPLGQPTRVNPKAGTATAWRGDPPTVAAAPDGTVYVGWTARDESAPHAGTLYLSASRDGGRSFAPPSKVNDDAKPGVHGMHSLAVSGDGRVYVAWLDERDIKPKEADAAKAPSHMHTESNRAVYFASSADGGRTFSPNRKIAENACPCCKTSIAAGPDGRIYVGWRQVLPGDFRHIGVASSPDGGESFSEPVTVSDDRWMISGCPVSGAALAAAGEGVVRVLWYTAGEAGAPGLYWSESRDGGRTFTPRRGFAEGGGAGTPVLLSDGGHGFVATWEGNGGGGQARPMAARLSEEGEVGAAAMADAGELPAAAVAEGHAFVAYVSKGSGHSGVWLARVDTPGPGGGPDDADHHQGRR